MSALSEGQKAAGVSFFKKSLKVRFAEKSHLKYKESAHSTRVVTSCLVHGGNASEIKRVLTTVTCDISRK